MGCDPRVSSNNERVSFEQYDKRFKYFIRRGFEEAVINESRVQALCLAWRHANHHDSKPHTTTAYYHLATPEMLQEDNRCPICSRDFRPIDAGDSEEYCKNPVAFGCAGSHVFGFDCIKSWNDTNLNCPSCRGVPVISCSRETRKSRMLCIYAHTIERIVRQNEITDDEPFRGLQIAVFSDFFNGVGDDVEFQHFRAFLPNAWDHITGNSTEDPAFIAEMAQFLATGCDGETWYRVKPQNRRKYIIVGSGPNGPMVITPDILVSDTDYRRELANRGFDVARLLAPGSRARAGLIEYIGQKSGHKVDPAAIGPEALSLITEFIDWNEEYLDPLAEHAEVVQMRDEIRRYEDDDEVEYVNVGFEKHMEMIMDGEAYRSRYNHGNDRGAHVEVRPAPAISYPVFE